MHTLHLFSLPRWLAAGLIALLLAAAGRAARAEPLEEALLHQVQDVALSGAAGAPSADGPPVRFEVEVGQLDPRLKLAPCQRIEPYLPTGARPWGRTRVGLRCTQGEKAWNVFLPITVKAWTAGWVTTGMLAAGTVLDATHLMQAEIDLADGPGQAVIDRDAAIGRLLARPLAAGSALRSPDLRDRQLFAAGELVRVRAAGPGFEIATEGQALAPGYEGRVVRVRTEGGRTIQGRVAGDKLVDATM